MGGHFARSLRGALKPSATAYLLSIPTVGDFLEEGLSAFDLSCEDIERGRL
jgi:hypothetical protein